METNPESSRIVIRKRGKSRQESCSGSQDGSRVHRLCQGQSGQDQHGVAVDIYARLMGQWLSERRNRHLGRRHKGIAGGRMARRAGRPRRAADRAAGSNRSRTPGSLRDRRYGDDRRPRRKAGPRDSARRQTAGTLRREGHQTPAARRRNAAGPL
jgi:hypothetical protein